MKNNNYWFIKKNYERHILVCLWLVTVLVSSFAITRLLIKNETLKREIELRKDVSVHQWIMSDSCSDQLMNSVDGILRIKTK